MPIPEPVAFTVFGIEVRWYGILIAAAIVVATIVVYKRAPLHELPQERVLDFVLLAVPAGIIGARFYYVVFNWQDYADNPLYALNLRTGGLAIHGGLIFSFLTVWLLCRYFKYSALNIFDLAAPAIALAQSIGRWGNYFNSEAHGGPTDLPWAVTVSGQTYHPTFLYESAWCMILFFILIWIDNRRSFNGQVFLLYGILYSVERFFVEALRTDSLMIGSLKQAQVLSASVILVFSIFYVMLKRRNKKH